MKKFLALLLAAVTVFALCAAPTFAADIPAEPKVADDAPIVYFGYGGAGAKDGSSPENFAASTGWSMFGNIWTYFSNGAIAVISQKGHMGASADMNFMGTVLFTSLDPKTNTSVMSLDADGNFITSSDGQLGSFMCEGTAAENQVTIYTDIIFENAVILCRKPTQKTTWSVADGGKFVIGTGTQILADTDCTPASLEVQAGGYAYLHCVGFSDYKGDGTIVLDPALVASGKVTKDTFANFTGTIVAQDGSDPFAAPAVTDAPIVTDAPAVDTEAPAVDTEAPATDAPATADFGIVAIILSAISLAAAAAVITKKIRNN